MTTTVKSPKGGTRPGAGRPALDVRPVTMRLSAQDIEQAKKLGDGNVTAGIRRALAAALTPPPECS